MNRIRCGFSLRAVAIWALALFTLGLSGCDADWFGLPQFHFTDPAALAQLTPDEVSFQLRIPFGSPLHRLDVTLDGESVDRAGWQGGGTRVMGELAGVGPGTHRLQAELPVRLLWFFEATLVAWTTFDVMGSASFDVRESVEQLHITGAEPDTEIELHDASGSRVDVGTTDSQGSLIFRLIAPGEGYELVATGSAESAPERAGPFRVASVEGSTPPQSFYDQQQLEPGYNYITTRDGTTLSAYVTLPGPLEDGPYPTVVNYSGYDPSQPGTSLLPKDSDLYGFILSLCSIDPGVDPLDLLCEGPNHPSGLLAGLMGYATVGVNLRGTACSGGAYDFYEPLQLLDGYDVVEVVAAQAWSGRIDEDGEQQNEAAMVGLSYPGISTLFVAQTQPPSLVAIAPVAVLANAVSSTLAPGGILNEGFALEWGQQVLDRADPFGHGWEQDQVDAGDTLCGDNQLLHSQKVDIIEKARSFPWYPPEVADPLAPELFAHKINVPVFTSGAWQDEQVGGNFPPLWGQFVNAPIVRAQAYNGAHADGFAPHTLMEWKTFLDFYVARELRPLDPFVAALAPQLFELIFGGMVFLPQDRFRDFDSFEEALAAYEAEDPVRLVFESGAGEPLQPGAPQESFDLRFPTWPPPETQPQRWYFHADGSLRDFPPDASEVDSASWFRFDRAKGHETFDNLDGGAAPARFGWTPWQDGRQVVFVSEPLTEDLVMAGHASADLWFRTDASAPCTPVPGRDCQDADLEVMLSEVRDDTAEIYVQSGWLRVSDRKVKEVPGQAFPELRPIHSGLEEDTDPPDPQAWNLTRVEIFPFGHVFRAGSRIRISVATPGGNRARWIFDLNQYEREVQHSVSHSAVFASSVVLPVIPDVEAPPLSEDLACALRAQPCRIYEEHSNRRLE